MALKMDVTPDQLNVMVKDAYVRVEQVTCNRFEEGIDCIARCYQSDPGFPPNIPAFKDIRFRAPFRLDGGDPYAQAYLGAKELPEFVGATDA